MTVRITYQQPDGTIDYKESTNPDYQTAKDEALAQIPPDATPTSIRNTNH